MQTLTALDARAFASGALGSFSTGGMLATLVTLGLWTALVFFLARRAAERLDERHFRMPAGALAAAAALAAYAACSKPLAMLVPAAVCIGLVAAGAVDAQTGLLVDAVTLPTAGLAAATACALGQAGDAALGVATTAGIFGALYLASRGRALGLGDVKAMYALGAAFGPLHATFAIAAASISGLCAALLRGRFVRGSAIRFGPHLAAGAALALLTMGS